MLVRAVLSVTCLYACVLHGRAQETCNFDMIFLVDSSGSIRETNRNGVDNYGLMVDFMKRMVDDLEVSTDPLWGVKIGIILFSDEGQVVRDFSADKDEIIGELNTLRYINGRTNTSGGLRVARQLLQGDENRQGVKDVILTITDGNHNIDVDLTEPYAQLIQNSGVTMFAVGVTDNVDSHNISILASPNSNGDVLEDEAYWLMPDFNSLASTLQGIIDVICDRMAEEPTNPPNVETTTESQNNNDNNDDLLIALIVVNALLVLGLIVLTLLCLRFYTACCDSAWCWCIRKRKEKVYVEKEVETVTKATQADDEPPAKGYEKDVVIVPTCNTCGNITQNCTCCKLCLRVDCCCDYVHESSSHQHNHNCAAPACAICNGCDPTHCHQCSTHAHEYASCNSQQNIGTCVCQTCILMHHAGEQPSIPAHNYSENLHTNCAHGHCMGSQCNELRGPSSCFESRHSALGIHPADFTLQTYTPRRPTRRARRMRARSHSERRASSDLQTSSGMSSETESCRSHVVLIERRGRKSRGAKKQVRTSSRGARNEGYSSNSEQSVRREERRRYVHIPYDCPKKSQSRTSEFLNESFHSTRATAGK